MVAPVVAVAAKPVVESATKSDGLVNQAFKLVVIIALALAVGIGLFLIWKLTGLLDPLTTFWETSGISSAVETPTLLSTVLITSLPFGRGYLGWKRFFN